MINRTASSLTFVLLCSICAQAALSQTSPAQTPDVPPSPRAPAAPSRSLPTTAAKAAQNEAGEPRVPSKELAKSAVQPADKRIDRVDLDTTTITGNRELPKVMYVVPWKKSDIGDLAGKPMNSLLDEVLAPVDRDVFRREVTYFHAVNSPLAQNPTPSAPPPRQGEK